MSQAMPFQSFVQAGFECSCHRFPDGRQLDLLASTGHAAWAGADYAAIKALGMTTARDGVRWHLVSPAANAYDWAPLLPLLRAAHEHRVEVIWDLCHYGWPPWLDIWSPSFPEAFARYAAAVARLIAAETDMPAWYCPINEISYWSWAGGDMAHFGPCATGRGPELKRQLARAAIQASDAIRDADPRARLVCAEPLIAIHAAQAADAAFAMAASDAQFEALDMICGRAEPDLGGDERYVDVIGLNYYPHNQWLHGSAPLHWEAPRYTPLAQLLQGCAHRYGKPLFIAETGAEGVARAPWVRYVGQQLAVARQRGIDVAGICLYPVTDYPGWEDDRHCPTGMLSAPMQDGRRSVYAPLEIELRLLAAQAGAPPAGLLAAPTGPARPACAVNPAGPDISPSLAPPACPANPACQHDGD